VIHTIKRGSRGRHRYTKGCRKGSAKSGASKRVTNFATTISSLASAIMFTSVPGCWRHVSATADLSYPRKDIARRRVMDAPARSYRVLLAIPLSYWHPRCDHEWEGGCSGGSPGGGGTHRSQASPRQHGPSVRGVSAELFSKRVSELTKGQVNVQIFGDSRLATEAQAIEGMQVGTSTWRHNDVLQCGDRRDGFRPAICLPGLRALGESSGRRSWKNGGGNSSRERATHPGLLVGGVSGGVRSKPIKTPADLKGVKIRILTMAPSCGAFSRPWVASRHRYLGPRPT